MNFLERTKSKADALLKAEELATKLFADGESQANIEIATRQLIFSMLAEDGVDTLDACARVNEHTRKLFRERNM